MSNARCLGFCSASRNRAISSWLRTTGSVLGALGRATSADDPVPAQGDAVEELEGKAGLLVDVRGDLPLLNQVEQVGADVLGPELVGRGVKVPGEISDPADVGPDRLGGTVAEDQVLGHATAQRGHGQLLSRRNAGTRSNVSPPPS